MSLVIVQWFARRWNLVPAEWAAAEYRRGYWTAERDTAHTICKLRAALDTYAKSARALPLLLGWGAYYRTTLTSRERAIMDYLRSEAPQSTNVAHPFRRWAVDLATPEEVDIADREGRPVKETKKFVRGDGAFVQDN